MTARIKRDHPDIAADVEAGKYPSMRAAAVVAGIWDGGIEVRLGD